MLPRLMKFTIGRGSIAVYYVALSILRDKALAEDVMQTTYMRVLKNIQGYALSTNASAWIIK